MEYENIFFVLSTAVIWLLRSLLIILITVLIVINSSHGLLVHGLNLAIDVFAIHFSAPRPIWILVGASLGFLLWIWRPAKVFMGDVGSTFLGAVFALLVLQASTWSEALGLLLVVNPLLGDAFMCLPRRPIVGLQVFQAHRLHLFQRFHLAGWPHARVSILYIAATAVLAFALLWGSFFWVITLVALVLSLGIWLDRQVSVPFPMASRS